MAKFFIFRPIFAICLSLIILIAGIISYLGLPVSQFPEIAPPCVVVTANYPGANAAVVEDTVARPIEQQMNGVEDMIYMYSRNTDDGIMTLTVYFKTGKNLSIAAVDVQNRVSQAQASLPAEVINLGVTVSKQSPSILQVLALYGDGKENYDDTFLNNYLTLTLKTELQRVEGVGDISIFTEKDYSIRYWLDSDKMAQLNVDASEVVGAISEQNREAASGQIGYPPTTGNVPFSKSVKVKGRMTTPEEFGDVIIRANNDGSMLRAKDLADVQLGSRYYKSTGRYNKSPAGLMAIYQSPSANGLATAEKVTARMKELAESFPPGLTYAIPYDSTLFVKSSMKETIHTLIEAFGLVFVVVLIFLGNLRATIIPILAVPISIIGTFAVFGPLGFGVNTMTLFAMVLAIGIVVDDAIVVVEAVEYHIERGLPPLDATLKAMEEVSGAVIGVAMVLVSVFIPVAFLGGITGMLYQQFAITLAVSVLLSAFLALSLTPALCAMILKPRHEGRGLLALFFKGFNKIFQKATSGYRFCSHLLIRRTVLALVLLCALYSGTVHLAKSTPTSFVPSEDQNALFGVGILPFGSSLERTEAYMAKVESYLFSVPEVENVILINGMNLFQATFNTYSGSVIILLKDWEQRRNPDQTQEAIIQKIMVGLNQLPEGVFVACGTPAISGLGMVDALQIELEDHKGLSTEDLNEVAQSYLGALIQHSETVASAYTFYTTKVPQVFVDIDRDKLKNLQVPIDRLFTALQCYLGSAYINQFTLFAHNYQIYVQSQPKFRMTEKNIENIYVKSNTGTMVPISTISSITSTNGPDNIMHYNGYRTAEIQASGLPGVSTGTLMSLMEKVAKESLPDGFTVEWTGISYQQKLTTVAQQIMIFGMALAFVFLVLASLYESWAVPFSILLGLPIGVFGAFIGLLLKGLPNDVYFQIGLVMLLGLAAKNAILIVEYAKARRDRGMAIEDAALEAATLRFRPILMTSFAFLLGVLPLVTAFGACAASRQALGTSVFFGMGTATLLGIFFIPSLYVFIQRIAEKISPPSKNQTQVENKN